MVFAEGLKVMATKVHIYDEINYSLWIIIANFGREDKRIDSNIYMTWSAEFNWIANKTLIWTFELKIGVVLLFFGFMVGNRRQSFDLIIKTTKMANFELNKCRALKRPEILERKTVHGHLCSLKSTKVN